MSSKDNKKKKEEKKPVKAAAKTVAKPAAKVQTKPAAKPVAKAPAKPAAKPAPAKAVAKPVKVVAKTAPPKIVAKPVAAKAAKPEPKVAVKAVVKTPAAKAPAVKAPAKVVKPEPKAAKVAKPEPKHEPKVEKIIESKIDPKIALKDNKDLKDSKDVRPAEVSILLKTFKLVRTPFFFEILEAEDRNNKKKYSSETKLPEKPTICVRNRSSLVEETPEELIERLAQELEEENFGMLREFGQQLCTKCGANTVSLEFRVDKDLGYCEECADILRLGQSKEARKSDYQLSLLRKDPLAADAEEGEVVGGTVDEEELEELEED